MHPTLIHCVGTVCRTSRIFLNWFFSRSETSALGLQPCNRFPRLACAQQREGFSLLEVLVACGILVIGLTSVAAILPAAGARFAEAALYDRAAAAANVGMSEVLLKNVASAKLFATVPAVPPVPYVPVAVVFGEVLPKLVLVNSISGITGPPTGIRAPTFITDANGEAVADGEPAKFLTSLFDMGTSPERRGFFLGDEVLYKAATASADTTDVYGTGGLPVRSVAANAAGVKAFKRGVCWGAMVTPYPWGVDPASMTQARVTVAVFKSSGEIKQIPLTLVSPGVYKMTTANEATRKKFLAGCSWALALPSTGAPQWLAINSSWKSGAAAYVSFRESSLPSGSTLTVVGFEGLLNVVDQLITIQ